MFARTLLRTRDSPWHEAAPRPPARVVGVSISGWSVSSTETAGSGYAGRSSGVNPAPGPQKRASTRTIERTDRAGGSLLRCDWLKFNGRDRGLNDQATSRHQRTERYTIDAV